MRDSYWKCPSINPTGRSDRCTATLVAIGRNDAADPDLIPTFSARRQIESFVANWLEAIKRSKRRMKTKARSKADPIERQIESAFRPGTFIRELHLQFHSSPVKIQSTAV